MPHQIKQFEMTSKWVSNTLGHPGHFFYTKTKSLGQNSINHL